MHGPSESGLNHSTAVPQPRGAGALARGLEGGRPLGCGAGGGLPHALVRAARERTEGVRVKMRAAASVLVAAGLISGLAACDAVTPQWTTHSYAASDGVNGQAGP